MGTLFILILLCIIFWPVLKLIWRIFVQAHRINRFMKDPSSFFTGEGRQTAYGSTSRSNERKKKFGSDVGEYVDFTDVSCKVSADDGGKEVKFKREEQITDIEWVDIEDERK